MGTVTVGAVKDTAGAAVKALKAEMAKHGVKYPELSDLAREVQGRWRFFCSNPDKARGWYTVLAGDSAELTDENGRLW